MSDQWRQLRKENIGGSDVAALFGEGYVSAYRLYHEKKGNVAPHDLDNDERVQAGRFFEAGAIEWANSKWETNFYQPKVYVKHPSIVGMGCTPDAFGEVPDDRFPLYRIAQIKWVDAWIFEREWTADGDTIIEAPLHILLQCQHEMACTGARENHLIVVVGGNKIFRMICLRDEDVIRIIEVKVEAFWKRFEMNIEPEPDYKEDGDVIRQITAKLPAADPVELTEDEYLSKLLDDLRAAMHKRKTSSDAEDVLKNELIHLYGEYNLIICGLNSVTIKPDKNGHIRVMMSSQQVAFEGVSNV